MFTIIQATSLHHLDGVRALMRGFLDWHRDRHSDEGDLVDGYFDPEKFETELAGLPGDYGPPRGKLLVAVDDTDDKTVAGCVALHDLGAGICEMKRMFVSADYLGKGLGRKLATGIVDAGREMGFATMRLDTGMRQVEALGLYASIGFKTIDAYYDMPAELREWLVFMEIDLQK